MSTALPLSFDLLYQAYSLRVYRWVSCLPHHHEAAEDATQDTFLWVWHYLATFDRAKGARSTWLCRMTVQVTSDQTGYRKARITTISLDILAWELHEHETADPQTRYAGSAEQVAVALGALPQHERLALAWIAAGYQEMEIVRRVGKIPRMVRTWRALGQMHLVQAMEGER